MSFLMKTNMELEQVEKGDETYKLVEIDLHDDACQIPQKDHEVVDHHDVVPDENQVTQDE